MTNLLDNGAFDGNLDEWEGDGTIDRSLGYPRLGCVKLAAGQSIYQDKQLSADQLHTLHYFYRLMDGATLTAAYGAVSQTHSGGETDVWREGVLAFALDAGLNGNVTFTAAGATVYVDTVALLAGGLPISRADIAAIVAADIADLATDASLTTTPATNGPEGDYSRAVDEALRSVGAVNRYGDPDVTRLLSTQTNDAIEAAKTAILQRLRTRYALETDVSLGPRRESRSQIAGSLDQMLSGSGADRRIKVGKLNHADWRR